MMTPQPITSPVQQLVLRVLADGTAWPTSALEGELAQRRHDVLPAVKELAARGLVERSDGGWKLVAPGRCGPTDADHDAVRKLRAVEDLLTTPYVGVAGQYFVSYDELRAILHPAPGGPR